MSGVLFRHKWIFNPPGDVEFRVVPSDTVFIGRIVKIATLIEKLDRIGQREKSMGESAGDINLIVRAGGQKHACPFPEMRRAEPNIDRYVECFSFDDST